MGIDGRPRFWSLGFGFGLESLGSGVLGLKILGFEVLSFGVGVLGF